MGCLFGYYGRKMDGLLEAMARLLSHRCARGWESTTFRAGEGTVAEIARGIPPWGKSDSHVTNGSVENAALGYSGVLFNAEEVASGTDCRGTLLNRLAAAAQKDPENLLKKLEGAFTLALAGNRDFYLVRDHAGVKAIYWTIHSERLVFASEVKALFADPLVRKEMRPAALSEYLTFSYIPGAGTMFEGIEELQPGCILKMSGGKYEVRRHFVFEELEYTDKAEKGIEEYAAQVRTALEESVADACRNSDNPPAVFLSGGIDSSAVLAVAARQFPDVPIKTFSIHFGPDYPNENEFVSMMVDRYKTDHTWLEIRPSTFLKRMDRIFWILDDPIGDPITVPNYLLSETASRFSTLVLNGEGGDPCFGGPKNIPMVLSQIYGPTETGLGGTSWIGQDYLLSYRKCYQDLGQILDPALLRRAGGEGRLLSIVEPFFQTDRPKSFLNKLMAANIRLKGANLILVKVDKMSSSNGILALPPLFSKRIIEASMRCPPWSKLDGNIEKAVLKKAVEDIVPKPIVDRPKSGMMVPVRFWFRDEMYRYAKRVLSKRNLRRTGFFRPDYVHKLLNYEMEDINGFRYGAKLWMLITFMIWHEQMFESSTEHPYGTEVTHRSLWSRWTGGKRKETGVEMR
jgi:asparagine synthase (glutamine-hydrolysing)